MEKTDKYIGKMLDNRYEILEVIGKGGMAYVYKARCHLLNRLVAIKILKDDYARDADFKRRFHAESQAVAMFSHPNIVAVYDVSRSSELEYIVMELVDGITLKQYMSKKGILSWREALHFVTQIVKALSHAHNRGIIHRDIKPHNIMILRDGSVKVADFGIARFASKQNTLTQEALGSVHYISPEQARGSHIDARSDLYSVGVVLYEMLTGRLPFEGDSAVSVAIQHINSLPLAPREINQDIPQALEIITIKAMAPQLAKRYGSAEEMLKDLEEFRKNPAIVFGYDIHELQTTADQEGNGSTPLPVNAKRNPPRNGVAPRKTETRKEGRKRREYNNLIAALLLVFFVLIIISVIGYYIHGMANDLFAPDKSERVAVPNMRGMTYTRDWQEEYERLYAITIQPMFEYNDQHPVNYIFDQDPKSNGTVLQFGTVTIYISQGAEQFAMPTLTAWHERDAKLEMDKHNLKCEIEYIEHPDVESGFVVSTVPDAGTMVSPGQLCRLVVSKGAQAKELYMPSLLGADAQEAYAILAINNLVRGAEKVVESDEPAGTVVWQSVEPDEVVAEYTEIDIHISQGPPEPEDPTDPPDGEDDPDTIDEEPFDPDLDQPIAVTATVTIPEDLGETVELRIEVDGIDVVFETIEAGRTVTRTLTGLPTYQVNVFFNNRLEYQTTLQELA